MREKRGKKIVGDQNEVDDIISTHLHLLLVYVLYRRCDKARCYK